MSDTYCPLIHFGFATSPVGGFRPCCEFDERYSVRTSVKEYKSSIVYNEILEAEKNNKFHPGCKYCEYKEKVGAESKRTRELKNFEKIKTEKIALLDLRLGNKCNMACVSCNPKNSSKIYQEMEEFVKEDSVTADDLISKLPVQYITSYHAIKDLEKISAGFGKPLDVSNPYSEEEILYLIDNLDENARVYFTGGEPSVVKGVQKYLDKLIELGLHKTIKLEFNSNFLAWNEKFLDKIAMFENGLMMVSIDDVGPRAEYIRYGTDWNKVQFNLLKFIKKAPQWEVKVVPTVSLLNILTLNQVIGWAESLNIEINLSNVLAGPPWMNIANLPPKTKKKVRRNLKKISHIRQVDSVRKMLDSQPRRDTRVMQEQLGRIDRLRGTDWKTTFPELYNEIGVLKWKS